MSGVQRFLSRKEKTKNSTTAKKDGHAERYGNVFTLDDHGKRKPDKEEDRKIKGIQARLQSHGIEKLTDANVEYCLRAVTPQGDPEAAFRLLILLEETCEGIVRPYDPDKKLLGAVNRESVTCYLDALLFSMFARLDSFEAMLYDSFEDAERRKLAGMLRLWVNLLRTGRLIPIDVTKALQGAMAACGWADAVETKQQDPSEAFGFITGKLGLPLLTLKMDLYHTGKEDPTDDHKFINERLLEVALPEQPAEGNAVITLEDCLEQYFNNRIEVKRHLENARRNTLRQNDFDEKSKADLHVDVSDLGLRPDTPLVQTPLSETPTTSTNNAFAKLRPSLSRGRADSIFSQRKLEIIGIDPTVQSGDAESPDLKVRKMSTRTEVLMPAWQFFKLLPWYTDHMPTSDAQVAAHFSKKRPVLGICLKRYSYNNAGKAQRLNTYIDIPLEIAVPNFVSDDNMGEDGPLIGNFRLLLQSVVCHRGVSVDSGHYICLSRGQAARTSRQSFSLDRASSDSDSDVEDPWMRFDDLAQTRVTQIDIHQALREETPYLLFYQVQPIDEDGNSIHDLPSYAEATSRSMSAAMSTLGLDEKIDPETRQGADASRGRLNIDRGVTSARTSLEVASISDERRGRSSTSIGPEERRRSIAFDETSMAGSQSLGSAPTEAIGNSLPPTPSDDKNTSFLSVIGSRRGSAKPSKSRSRPASNGPDASSGRFSLNMAKLTSKMIRSEVVSPASETPSIDLLSAVPAVTDKAPAVVSTIALPAADSKDNIVTAVQMIKDKKKSRSKTAKVGKAEREDRECALM